MQQSKIYFLVRKSGYLVSNNGEKSDIGFYDSLAFFNNDAVEGREWHGDAAQVLKRRRDVSEQNGFL